MGARTGVRAFPVNFPSGGGVGRTDRPAQPGMMYDAHSPPGEDCNGCGAAWRGVGLWRTLHADPACADLAPGREDGGPTGGGAAALLVAPGRVRCRDRGAGHRVRADPVAPLWRIEAHLTTPKSAWQCLGDPGFLLRFVFRRGTRESCLTRALPGAGTIRNSPRTAAEPPPVIR